VQGHFVSHQESGLREKLQMYGWQSDERQFIAILFQLNGFASLEGRFSAGDEDLVTFAAANIVEELAREQYEQVGVVNFHNFSVGLLLSFPADHPAGWLTEDLDAFCTNVVHTLKRLLHMQVTASFSRPTEFVQQIPRIFEETQQALQFRDLSDDLQIIQAGQPSEASAMAGHYPFSLEKEIVHAIRNGLEPEAVERIGQFLEELSRGGATELTVQQGMLQLLAGIRYTALQSGLNPVLLFGGVNLFDQLAQIKEPEQMLRWFEHKVVAVFVQELISRQDFFLKQMVEKVVTYLRTYYMEALSLDSCAERFGTSPYTLSRAFKQVTGINFIDYLTQIRIDQAKSLLRESELKINDIADQVGYRHTYFNRIFKKYEGITPSHYRELNRV
jgi:AraC-like DNA-binding protein